MSNITENYQAALDIIIGKERVTVRLIHNDEDICMNSNERELLYSIQNVQRRDYNVEWVFREGLFGMALMLPLKHHVSSVFVDFASEYKILFNKRIQKIINQYNTKELDEEKELFYQQCKIKWEALNKKSYINFDEYKEVRELFERVRY